MTAWMGRRDSFLKNRVLYWFYGLLLILCASCTLFIYSTIDESRSYKIKNNQNSVHFDCALSTLAQSAVNRSHSASCREDIRNTYCKFNAGELYSSHFQSTCPLRGKSHSSLRRLSSNEASSETPEHFVRIVFFLQMNGRAVRQIKRLLRTIYRPEHYYFIHVDSRQDYLYRELLELESRFANVRLNRRRYGTIWGGASLLDMTLDTFGQLVRSRDEDGLGWSDWDFVMNWSESDYLLRPLDDLIKLLSIHRDENFLKSHGTTVERFTKKQGLDKLFFECDSHLWRIGERAVPRNISIDGGSDWYALGRKFVHYAVNSNDKVKMDLRNYFRYALLPVESYFHTLLLNSPMCESRLNSNLKLTNWKRDQGCKCQYKHLVDWCGCSPKVFQTGDMKRFRLPQMKQKFLFTARKFEAIINQRIIELIETSSLDIKNAKMINYNSYWQNDYHYFDTSPKTNIAKMNLLRALAVLTLNYTMGILSDNSMIYGCVNQRFDKRFQKYSNDFQIRELTIFRKSDAFQGLILTLSISCGAQSYKLEALVKRGEHLWVKSNSTPNSSLTGFEIGTQFDPKELIFRNYAGAISRNDLFTLLLRWNSTNSPKLVAVLISPSGSKIKYVIKSTGADSTVVQMTPELSNQKRQIGMWKVRLEYSNKFVAKSAFLVFPETPLSDNTDQFSEFLPSVSRFYKISDVCISGDKRDLNMGIYYCESMDWSTLAPDPKSEI